MHVGGVCVWSEPSDVAGASARRRPLTPPSSASVQEACTGAPQGSAPAAAAAGARSSPSSASAGFAAPACAAGGSCAARSPPGRGAVVGEGRVRVLAAARARLERGRSSGAFSGMAGCTPSTASQCGTTPTSNGHRGSGAPTTCARPRQRASSGAPGTPHARTGRARRAICRAPSAQPAARVPTGLGCLELRPACPSSAGGQHSRAGVTGCPWGAGAPGRC